MKFRSLRSLVGGLLALAAALLLTACGGGGASGNPNVSGPLSIIPATGSLYGGIPATFQILGGRKPYALASSEPGLLPVPARLDSNSFEVLPANPGVIDSGLKPKDLPVRTVNIQVRSSDGQSATAVVKVGINFLTGYGISMKPLTCPLATPAAGATACAGGETAVTLAATFNGNLMGGREFRLEAEKGQFYFVYPQTGVVGNSVTVTSDHTGTITTVLQVSAGVPTQIGVLRVIDVATGVYADFAFVIAGTSGNGVLTPIPDTITFTGNLTTDCGIGTATLFVYDGTPPFAAVSSSPGITVTPAQSNSNPGQFSVTINSNTPPCQSGTVIVTDSLGARATVSVTSQPGSVTPPTPTAFTVAPTSLTLLCGQSGSVTAVGGTGSYSANSTSPDVTATVSGSTVTITRAATGTDSGTNTVSITDGSTIQSVTVTAPPVCP